MALAQLVSSQLDVDRMDYLLRDSLMTGVKYGVFDLEWIIKSLEINEETDQLYVSARGIYAVEDYLHRLAITDMAVRPATKMSTRLPEAAQNLSRSAF